MVGVGVRYTGGDWDGAMGGMAGLHSVCRDDGLPDYADEFSVGCLGGRGRRGGVEGEWVRASGRDGEPDWPCGVPGVCAETAGVGVVNHLGDYVPARAANDSVRRLGALMRGFWWGFSTAVGRAVGHVVVWAVVVGVVIWAVGHVPAGGLYQVLSRVVFGR